MKKAALVSIVASLLTAGGTPAAAPPRYVTNFNFEVHFADATTTYNQNQEKWAFVWIPPSQAPWECVRTAIGAVFEGRSRGSFSCSNDGWKTNVLTLIGCKSGEPDPLRTAAMRIFAPRTDGLAQGMPADAGADPTVLFGKFIDLVVSCETVPVR
jgi:hypothetical protein